jgi:Imm-5 like putative immunity protein
MRLNRRLKQSYQRIPRLSRRHRAVALRAAREAMAVLRLFEAERPRDTRPRDAIVAIRAWAQGKGELGMHATRRLSLNAHAAARAARTEAACFAARAAGHAVATWHVPTHALGAPLYAKKARVAARTT